MQKRKFDELVSYFNKKVSEMEVETKYKMELLGMVTALGCAHEKEMSDLSETKRDSSDLISRQAAIELIERMKPCHQDADDIAEMIDNMPSAQPEPCGDTISREYLKEHIKACWINGRPMYAPELNELLSWIDDVPSVQPEPIRINLNEPIKVKLTDWGKEIYYHQYDRTNQIAGKEICKPKFPEEDENGHTEFQLWCFMELYGEHMGMTLPNVIKPLEIVYEG